MQESTKVHSGGPMRLLGFLEEFRCFLQGCSTPKKLHWKVFTQQG